MVDTCNVTNLRNLCNVMASTGGDDDLERGTRLHWFDSRLGSGGDTVPTPYTPINVVSTMLRITRTRSAPVGASDAIAVSLLGKTFSVDASGSVYTRLRAREPLQLQHARGRCWGCAVTLSSTTGRPVGMLPTLQSVGVAVC